MVALTTFPCFPSLLHANLNGIRMKWNDLRDKAELEAIKEKSFSEPVILFKHSTRCSISMMAKSRLERESEWTVGKFFYLDLLKHRDISNAIAEDFSIHHESPQLIMLVNGECVYDASHNAITTDELKEQLSRYSS